MKSKMLKEFIKDFFKKLGLKLYKYLKTAIQYHEKQMWEAEIRKKLKKCGKNVHFNGISKIYGLENIEIGNNVHIGENAYIRGEGGLIIGDNTHISRNLVLYTVNHNYEGERLPYDEKLIKNLSK